MMSLAALDQRICELEEPRTEILDRMSRKGHSAVKIIPLPSSNLITVERFSSRRPPARHLWE